MLKRLMLAVGVVEVLFPKRVIRTAERIALENPGDCDLRGSTVPIARLEGITYLAFVLRGDTSAPWFRRLFGLFGAFAFLFPRQCMGLGTRLAYRNSDECEWKPWVEPATRVVGLFYVLVAVSGVLNDRSAGAEIQPIDEEVTA